MHKVSHQMRRILCKLKFIVVNLTELDVTDNCMKEKIGSTGRERLIRTRLIRSST